MKCLLEFLELECNNENSSGLRIALYGRRHDALMSPITLRGELFSIQGQTLHVALSMMCPREAVPFSTIMRPLTLVELLHRNWFGLLRPEALQNLIFEERESAAALKRCTFTI